MRALPLALPLALLACLAFPAHAAAQDPLGPTLGAWAELGGHLQGIPEDAHRWALWFEEAGLHFGLWGVGLAVEGWDNLRRQLPPFPV